MSKNSRQKTERRHKREVKQKRRDQQQQHTMRVRQARTMSIPPITATFDKSAWLALRPDTNTVSAVKPKPVLTQNQGFDLQKWKPDEKDS